MNNVNKLREKRGFHFTTGWIDDAIPKEVGLLIDKNGELRIAGIYWEKPNGDGAYDDENLFSMALYVCRL